MRFLIMLEQTKPGFAVQVPDLAITTFGDDIDAAKKAAREAIEVNLDAYREAGQRVPEVEPVLRHLENPDFKDLLFAYVDVSESQGKIAA
jgi:predicted RNase H-like HicB family nuclease